MIRYALSCADGHLFDTWFRDATTYETQEAAGHLACPVCQSAKVSKRIMAPAVVSGRRSAPPSDPQLPPETAAPPQTTPVALLDEKAQALRAAIASFRARLQAEGHDVGPRFATEARRMHEGEIPERQIYGEATAADALDLIEDGILVMPVPRLPEEQN